MTKVTGWDNGLCQDYDKGLGRWFANRLGARQQLRQDFKMTQVLIDRATLEQLVVALNNAEDALNNSQALIAGRERLGFAKTAYAANENALGFISLAITAGRAALANAEPTCTWSKDPDFEMGDTYDSACGEKWSFIDGGPTENRVSFCQGCGKPVKIVQDTL